MARPKKEDSVSEENKQTNEDVSKNLLNSLLNGYKEDHFNFIDTPKFKVSSGSLQLDSLVHFQTGQVIRLCGKGAELGKSSESLLIADNLMKVSPKAKTMYVMCEGRLSDELKARTGMRYVYKAEEWEYGTVFVFKCNVFETFAQITETLLKTMFEQGETLCVIVDSLDGMILKNDLQAKEFAEGTKVAGVPLLTKLLFKRLALPIEAYNALMIFLTQYSAEIKLDPYSSSAPRQGEGSGGNSIAHQNSYTLLYHPRYNGDYILENDKEKPDPIKNKILGVWATVEIKKSATDVTNTKIKIPIVKGRIGSAIWVEKEVADMIINWNLAERKGAWISFSESIINEAKEAGVELKPQIQGMNNLYDYLQNDRTVFEWFYNKFQTLLCND